MSRARAMDARGVADAFVGRSLDRYEILSRLASGGMGTVYAARARAVGGFERLVALKVLHPHLAHEEDFISMFLDEARLAARIRHPNVVGTLDVRHGGGVYYLVMEYIEGDTLAALLKKASLERRALPAPVSLRIVTDALLGLAAAHSLRGSDGEPLQLVHRDVSPQNILVGSDGVARLTDFGVAKAEVRLSSTREGQFKGKLAYAAPEQASEGKASQRSDLFAMGVVLWESLTGRRLFRAESSHTVLKMILEDPIRLPSEVRPELAPFDAVIARALARPLEERFQSAAEMADAVEEASRFLGGLSSGRVVSELVGTLAEEKLREEARLIEEGIRRLGDRPPPTVRGSYEETLSLPEIAGSAGGMSGRRRTLRTAVWILTVAMIGGAFAYYQGIGAPGWEAFGAKMAQWTGWAAPPAAGARAPEAPRDPAVSAREPEEPSASPREAAPAEAVSRDQQPSAEQARRARRRARRQAQRRRARARSRTAKPAPEEDILSNPYRQN